MVSGLPMASRMNLWNVSLAMVGLPEVGAGKKGPKPNLEDEQNGGQVPYP